MALWEVVENYGRFGGIVGAEGYCSSLWKVGAIWELGGSMCGRGG